jgi:signal transduction histidine kinase
MARHFFLAASAARDAAAVKEALQQFLVEGMAARRYLLFVRDDATLEFAPFDFHPANTRPAPRSIAASSPLVRLYLLERPDFLRLPDGNRPESGSELATASRAQLRDWDTEWCFPLFASSDLVGLLALGGRRDNEPFTAEEAGSLSFAARILGMLAREFSLKDELELTRGLSRDMAREVEDAADRAKALAEIAADAAPPARLREPLAAVERGIENLYACADEARFFSGARPAQIRPMRLDHAVQNAARRAEARGRKKGVRITIAPMAAHACEGDESLIVRMIFNVICNAVDASESKSQIEVEVRHLHKESDRPAWLRVRVLDWGSGVSEASLKKLASGPFGGSFDEPASLGLAIARRIARLHGGQLVVFSEEGIGACVEVDLPGIATGQMEDQPALPPSEAAKR